MEYLKQERSGTGAKKILFTGLDTAGKTSIILTMQKEYSKIAYVSPTKGAQRRIFKFLDLEVSEWDLGGQSAYRISYLKNPDKYFDNTEVAIFVIDIQNKTRVSEAVSYLSDVVNQFKTLKIAPPLYIFWHKFDPDLSKKTKQDYINLMNTWEGKLRSELHVKVDSCYLTSVYDVPTIIYAISEILLVLYPKSELIKKTISEYCNKINCDRMLLLDPNSLLVGSFCKEQDNADFLSASMPHFIKFHDALRRNKILNDDPENQIIIQQPKSYVLLKKILLKEGTLPFYLLVQKKGKYFYQEDFEPLINILREIIYK